MTKSQAIINVGVNISLEQILGVQLHIDLEMHQD